jgi:hypothetical protein
LASHLLFESLCSVHMASDNLIVMYATIYNKNLTLPLYKKLLPFCEER